MRNGPDAEECSLRSIAGAGVPRNVRTADSRLESRSADAPRGAAGAVFERDAEFAEPLADQVRLVEERFLQRVVLRGLFRDRAEVVPQVEEQLHQPRDEFVPAVEC